MSRRPGRSGPGRLVEAKELAHYHLCADSRRAAGDVDRDVGDSIRVRSSTVLFTAVVAPCPTAWAETVNPWRAAEVTAATTSSSSCTVTIAAAALVDRAHPAEPQVVPAGVAGYGDLSGQQGGELLQRLGGARVRLWVMTHRSSDLSLSRGLMDVTLAGSLTAPAREVPALPLATAGCRARGLD